MPWNSHGIWCGFWPNWRWFVTWNDMEFPWESMLYFFQGVVFTIKTLSTECFSFLFWLQTQRRDTADRQRSKSSPTLCLHWSSGLRGRLGWIFKFWKFGKSHGSWRTTENYWSESKYHSSFKREFGSRDFYGRDLHHSFKNPDLHPKSAQGL